MTKLFIWVGIFVGSSLFGCIPMIWGDDYFSPASIGLSFVGSIVGLVGGWKLAQILGG
jgi:hypothetical protein